MKDILTKKNVKRLLVLLTVVALAVVLTGCASSNNTEPVSHTSGSWWNRWVIYYMSTFLLWLSKLIGNNYGWAIIIFTVIVRLILYPLSAIQIKSTTKMQKFSLRWTLFVKSILVATQNRVLCFRRRLTNYIKRLELILMLAACL